MAVYMKTAGCRYICIHSPLPQMGKARVTQVTLHMITTSVGATSTAAWETRMPSDSRAQKTKNEAPSLDAPPRGRVNGAEQWGLGLLC